MSCAVSGCMTANKTPTCVYCPAHYQRKRLGMSLTAPARTRRGQDNPTTQQPTQHPTVRDIAWTAGFLEGEGSFHNGLGSTVVSAVQVNKEPIQRLLELFGGSAKQYNLHGRDNNKPIWRWSVSGAKGRGLAMTVYVLMSAKRQAQIRHALHPTKYPKYAAA